MLSGSAYYSISNQSPSNVRFYESLVAQRRIFTASKKLSEGWTSQKPPCIRFGGSLLPISRRGLSAAAPDSYRESAEGKVSESPATEEAKPASDRGHPQPFRGVCDRLPRASAAAAAAPWQRQGPALPACCRAALASGGPSQPRVQPLRTLPPRHPGSRGDVCSATPPGSVTWSFRWPLHVRGARCRPRRRLQPLPRMPRSAGLRGKLRDAGSAAEAPLRSPADAGSAGPLPPGMELRPGARHRRRGSREGGRLPVTVATQRVFIPSCLRPPGLPSRAAPDPTPRRSPRRPPGCFGGSGTEPSVPGGGAPRCLRPAPRRPGRRRPAPPRSGPAAAPAGSGQAPPPGWALPLRWAPHSPPAAGGREPGEAPASGFLVRNAPKLPACGDGTAGCS